MDAVLKPAGDERNALFLTERVSANKTADVLGWIITFIAYLFAVLTFPVSVFCCVKVRGRYIAKRAIVFKKQKKSQRRLRFRARVFVSWQTQRCSLSTADQI